MGAMVWIHGWSRSDALDLTPDELAWWLTQRTAIEQRMGEGA